MIFTNNCIVGFFLFLNRTVLGIHKNSYQQLQTDVVTYTTVLWVCRQVKPTLFINSFKTASTDQSA